MGERELQTICSIVVFLIVFDFAIAAIVFYEPPYLAHIAENYTFNILFYIDGDETEQPLCGITQGDAHSNCNNKAAADLYLTGILGNSSYLVSLTKPQNVKDVELFGKRTYEISLSIKPPAPVEVPPTPPPVVFPASLVSVTLSTTTPMPQLKVVPPFVSLPDFSVPVSVFCCTPTARNPSDYFNETTVVLRPISLLPANWTTESDRATFKRFANPAHVERSTCACDLRSDYCDTMCCCDDRCSDLEKLRFGCYGNILKYPFKQPASIPTPPYDCADLLTGNSMPYPPVSVFNPFPHAWFCLMYRNTAYLGEHFTDLDYDSIHDQKYLEKNKKATPGYSFYSSSEFISQGYKEGIPLLIISANSQNQLTTTGSAKTTQIGSQPLRAARFFPGRGLDGRCLHKVPIRFLSKSDTVYCKSQPLSTPGHCRREFSQFPYIPSPDTIIRRVDRLGNAEMLPSLPCNCTVQSRSKQSLSLSCQFNNDTICPPKSTETTQPVSSQLRCGCSAPDITTPGIDMGDDPSNWFCTNVVKSVELRLGWSGNGTDPTTSNISVTLLDKLSPGESTEQKFSVSFAKLSSSNRRSSSSQPWRWYQQGDHVNYLPQTTSDPATCGCLSPLPIRFGHGSFAACPFDLTPSTFDDCDDLRGMAIAALRKMVPAELVSKIALPIFPGASTAPLDNGLPRPNNDWVTVAKLRQFPPTYQNCGTSRVQSSPNIPKILGRYPQLFRQLDGNSQQAFSTGNASSVTFCGKQPSRLVDDIIIGNGNATNSTERVANIVWAAACGTKRICERVPSAIQLTIFRSISGATNGTIQHEIVGAAVSFSVRDWFFDSDRPKQQRFLSASVKFVSIPATPPKPSFYERLVAMTTAWEILYPIKGTIDPDNVRPIAAATGIGLLLVAVLIIAPPR